MTANRDLTRVVRSWLKENEHESADRVLDVVLARLDTTPQRRSWWPARRSHQMPSTMKLAAGAAAVLLVLVVGFQLLPGSGGFGGPPATASPSVSPSPTPGASPSPIEMGDTNRLLVAGTYRVADPLTPFTISFPADWRLQTAEPGGVALYRSQPLGFAPGLTISRVHQVYADPCHPDPASPPPDALRSGSEIVAQLRVMQGFTAGPVSDATIGGHPAKAFRLTNGITAAEAAQCEGSPLDMWESGLGRMNTNQGATDQIWVVDVNGTPITIDGGSIPDQTQADLIAEVEQIVQSIQFDK